MASTSPFKSKKLLGQDPRDKSTRGLDKDGNMNPDESKVSNDIDNRDQADIDKGKGRSGTPSASDKQSAKEAVDRQNKLGNAEEGYNNDTGKGLTDDAPAVSDSLKKRYSKFIKSGDLEGFKKAVGADVEAQSPKKTRSVAEKQQALYGSNQ